jgi:hypothetical protein
MVEQHIPVTQIRPRFKILTELSPEEIAEKLTLGLSREACPCIGKVSKSYGTLKVPKVEQHYWSPQLNLTIEKTEEGTLVRGLYGPRPTVWSMFVFFYAVIAFAALIVGIIGLSMMTLDKSSAILWLVPVLALIFLSLYHVAYIGKKKGYDQSETIHRFFEECTGLSY